MAAARKVDTAAAATGLGGVLGGDNDVGRYIEGLPMGLGSHPQCECKGSIVTTVLSQQPAPVLHELRALPEPLGSLVRNPPVATAWAPEVHVIALSLAANVLGEVSESQARRVALDINKRLFESPMYRALAVLIRPERVLRYSGTLWNRMHRGTSLDWEPGAERSMKGVLRFPDRLVPRPMALAWSTVFEAVSELGGPGATCEVGEIDDTRAHFRVRWHGST